MFGRLSLRDDPQQSIRTWVGTLVHMHISNSFLSSCLAYVALHIDREYFITALWEPVTWLESLQKRSS